MTVSRTAPANKVGRVPLTVARRLTIELVQATKEIKAMAVHRLPLSRDSQARVLLRHLLEHAEVAGRDQAG